MSLMDSPNLCRPAECATDASAGLFGNSTSTYTNSPSTTTTQYSSSNNNSGSNLDEHLFGDLDFISQSPALSYFSTPDLGFLDTPETIISHDFETHFSPQLSRGNSYKSFDECASKDPMFQDVTLFPSFNQIEEVAPSLHANFEFLEKPSKPEVFVDASALLLNSGTEAASVPASPMTPSLSASVSLEMPPPRAIPLGSGRVNKAQKRKSSPSEDGEGSPRETLLKRRPSEAEDEDEAKVILRAKNTEAAARSRARKKAAMEVAEKRILELELENTKLRIQLAQSQAALSVQKQ